MLRDLILRLTGGNCYLIFFDRFYGLPISVKINTCTLLSAYSSTTLDKLSRAAKKTNTIVSLIDGDSLACIDMIHLSPECVADIFGIHNCLLCIFIKLL